MAPLLQTNLQRGALRLLNFRTSHSTNATLVDNFLHLHPSFTNQAECESLRKSFSLYPVFIDEREEQSLSTEVEPVLKRLRYEADHWDSAILGYRETEKKDWNKDNENILQRVREMAFPKGASMPLVHVLDLKEDGVIKPHVDSIKFCGNTIAGLSLLTDAVMRLAREDDTTLTADILLPRRSLYIMTGISRYKYTHAILGNQESIFKGLPVKKGRRISIICRNDP